MRCLYGDCNFDRVDHRLTSVSRIGVDAFDEHIELLEHAFAILQARMLRPIARSKRRRNTLLTISRLPVELFVEIAAYALRDSARGSYYPKDILALMLVCSQWHGIIENTPALWSHLNAHLPLKYNSAAMRKSRSAHLSFYQLLDHTPRDNEPYATFLKLLLPEVCRWSSVTISPQMLDKQDLSYLCQTAPRIASFSMNLSLLGRKQCLRQPLDLFGGCAPRLRTLALVAVPIPLTSPILTRLTSLSLKFSPYNRPSTLDLLQILDQCPGLAELSLSDRDSPSDLPLACGQASRNIQLPHLFKLTLEYLDLDMSCSLFNSIAAPNCLELQLASVFTEHHATISLPSTDQFTHSLPKVFARLQVAQNITVEDPSETYVRIMFHADGDRCLELWLHDYDLSSALAWLGQLTTGLQTKPARVEFDDFKTADWDTLDALDERLNVVGLSAMSCEEDLDLMDDLLLYLGTPNTEPNILRWPFLNLTEVKLMPESIEPSNIRKMVVSRYYGISSKESTWRKTDGVTLCLPKRFNLLHVAGVCPDEKRREDVEIMVGDDELVWEDKRVW